MVKEMETKIVRVSDKGQIALPISIRESMNISRGDELIVIRKDNSVIIKKLNINDFKDLLKHSETVAKELWGNKEDDIWDKV